MRTPALGRPAARAAATTSRPGSVDTELSIHARDELRDGIQRQVQSIEQLRPQDIAEVVI